VSDREVGLLGSGGGRGGAIDEEDGTKRAVEQGKKEAVEMVGGGARRAVEDDGNCAVEQRDKVKDGDGT
jgi:hypothetical protein